MPTPSRSVRAFPQSSARGIHILRPPKTHCPFGINAEAITTAVPTILPPPLLHLSLSVAFRFRAVKENTTPDFPSAPFAINGSFCGSPCVLSKNSWKVRSILTAADFLCLSLPLLPAAAAHSLIPVPHPGTADLSGFTTYRPTRPASPATANRYGK